MHSNGRRLRLMGRLIAKNKKYFIGAAVCTLLSVAVDYMTPLLLAETLDHYLSGKPSQLPAFLNSLVERAGGASFMAPLMAYLALSLIQMFLQ